MNRFMFLLAGFVVFNATPLVLRAVRAASPRWRGRLALVSLVGMGLTTSALLAAVLLPDALTAPGLGSALRMCSRALSSLAHHPVARAPSMAAGIALGLVLGRFAWALVSSVRINRRTLVHGLEPRWHVAGRIPVYVLPTTRPLAFSFGWVRRQVVVSDGLLEGLDPDERRAVLLHEEGHVRAGHHRTLLLARSVAAALRPLPSASATLRTLEHAMEECADDYAATRIGDRAVVASSLSKAALAGLEAPAGALALGTDHTIADRVTRLLQERAGRGRATVACLVALGALVGILAGTQVVAALALVAAAHHVVVMGAATACPLRR